MKNNSTNKALIEVVGILKSENDTLKREIRSLRNSSSAYTRGMDDAIDQVNRLDEEGDREYDLYVNELEHEVEVLGDELRFLRELVGFGEEES